MIGLLTKSRIEPVNNTPPLHTSHPTHIPQICILHTIVNMTEPVLIRQNECSSFTVNDKPILEKLYGIAVCVAHTMHMIFRDRWEDVAQLK